MNATEIITKFEQYVDDSSELSTAEELALLNKIYHKVCDDRPWEFLKKEASGTMATTTTITLPTDFGYLLDNYNYTDNSTSINNNARPVMIFINNNPIQVVNWSDRRQYATSSAYCYLNLSNSTITFPVAQTSSATYSFDYIYIPTDLVGGGSPTSPVFPARFHDILYHGMAVDDMICQLFDKARSYAVENQLKYNDYLKSMAYWNSQLQMN
jgi:hypothetical protein